MQFIGIAEETADNSAGSPGDKWIRIRRRGLAAFIGSGLTVANIGSKVYFVSGSDDHTVSTTSSAIWAGYLAAFGLAPGASEGATPSIAWVDFAQAVADFGTAASGSVTSAGVLSGGTYQATHAADTTQNYAFGTKRTYADGRIYRYGCAGTGGVSSEFGAVSPR